ncbi:organoarsenical effux MFS transporter ArsJ [Pokkaliibacter sp. CJK22405]|uniref:organoarsenical effux MFS transporter ArsJ n=1 Tax=Pokkaliibacter sp. CJK22405 TaxID=3384615 RepID=UPI003984A334
MSLALRLRERLGLTSPIAQYGVITGNYWAFTLTDGALRMLVVLHFAQLGYRPLAIASLFLFYEFFGVVTNLVGGFLGARIGLNRTMQLGLGMQIIALAMLLVPNPMLTVVWMMVAQALSGIAKDLNKMSAKTSIKALVPKEANSRLFRYVALLTGSKNALKGVGFFLGGVLLASLGFQGAMAAMALALVLVWLFSLLALQPSLGKAKHKNRLRELLSPSRTVNVLSAARFFLFGARDIWFVVALPVYLAEQQGWSMQAVGGSLALWVIGYGVVQSLTPLLLRQKSAGALPGKNAMPGKGALLFWGSVLALVPLAMGWVDGLPVVWLLAGLGLFGVLFALNSSLHSYLIVASAREEGASLDVGFYYMANAAGRLVGTLLSGWLYQQAGLGGSLLGTALFVALAVLCTAALEWNSPKRD